MLDRILSLAEPALAAKAPEAASHRFFETMRPLGATYLQTRSYRRPRGPLTNESHFAAGGVVKRIAPEQWPGSPGFKYVCFECNPLLGAIRENRTRYRFSDFAPHASRSYGKYWEAMSEADIADALCATSYGPEGRITSLHLGFARRKFGEEEALAVQLAGLMLTERLMEMQAEAANGNAARAPDAETLTPRERDCMAFVAEGKSDWEISVILGISQSTAKFHVDNARKKLGAVNRAQAVARFVAWGGL